VSFHAAFSVMEEMNVQLRSGAHRYQVRGPDHLLTALKMTSDTTHNRYRATQLGGSLNVTLCQIRTAESQSQSSYLGHVVLECILSLRITLDSVTGHLTPDLLKPAAGGMRGPAGRVLRHMYGGICAQSGRGPAPTSSLLCVAAMQSWQQERPQRADSLR
jgi:hypothetical protein